VSYLWYWPDGGWDFDAWQQKYSPGAVHSEQSGVSHPVPLVHAVWSGEEGVTHWEAERAKWRKVSDELLGTVCDIPPDTPDWELLGPEVYCSALPAPYTLRRLRYRLTDREWGYAWLLKPQNLPYPRPAVIALHQTNPSGKTEVVGLEVSGSDDYMHYGAELAARGFVVLAPDAIAFGERAAGHGHALYHSAEEFFTTHPEGSVMAKMTFDLSRAVDLLHVMPDVVSDRIGCIGHSHGGYGTLFAMIAEPRIKAGVISCGMNLLRNDPSPERWWRKTALIPRLGTYERDLTQTPLDFHHWTALVAPRPLMVVAGTRDRIFPHVGRAPWLHLVRQVYALYGAEDSLHAWIFDGEHAFPPSARLEAYQMLARTLAR
jgi:dienelactone hydrolase